MKINLRITFVLFVAVLFPRILFAGNVRVDDTTGTILYPTNLNGLPVSAFKTNGVTPGQALVFDGTNWTNTTITAAATNVTLASLGTNGASVGDAIVFNGSVWVHTNQLYNLNGSNLITGTLTSNKFEAGTLALLTAGGSPPAFNPNQFESRGGSTNLIAGVRTTNHNGYGMAFYAGSLGVSNTLRVDQVLGTNGAPYPAANGSRIHFLDDGMDLGAGALRVFRLGVNIQAPLNVGSGSGPSAGTNGYLYADTSGDVSVTNPPFGGGSSADIRTNSINTFTGILQVCGGITSCSPLVVFSPLVNSNAAFYSGPDTNGFILSGFTGTNAAYNAHYVQTSPGNWTIDGGGVVVIYDVGTYGGSVVYDQVTFGYIATNASLPWIGTFAAGNGDTATAALDISTPAATFTGNTRTTGTNASGYGVFTNDASAGRVLTTNITDRAGQSLDVYATNTGLVRIFTVPGEPPSFVISNGVTTIGTNSAHFDAQGNFTLIGQPTSTSFIARYFADSSYNDESANHLDGINHSVSFVSGCSGDAFSLVGNNYVELPTDGDLLKLAGDWTISANIKMPGGSDGNWIFSTAFSTSIIFYYDVGSTHWLSLTANGGGDLFDLGGFGDILRDDTFHFVAVSRRSGEIFVCIDGAVADAGAFAPDSSSFGPKIGQEIYGDTSHTMTVDDLQVYNFGLTTNQLQLLYTNGCQGDPITVSGGGIAVGISNNIAVFNVPVTNNGPQTFTAPVVFTAGVTGDNSGSPPITSQTNVIAFGDSITEGTGATPQIEQYSTRKGLNLSANHAAGGQVLYWSADPSRIYAASPADDQIYWLAHGFGENAFTTNDVQITNGFKKELLACIAWLGVHVDKKAKGDSSPDGISQTQFANTHDPLYYDFADCSATNGDTHTVNGLIGDTIFVQMTGTDPTQVENGGAFTISVDGVVKVTDTTAFDTDMGVSASSTPHYDYLPKGYLIAGLTNGTHTLVVTVTSDSADTNDVIFDWCAALTPATTKRIGPSVIVGGVTRAGASEQADVTRYNGNYDFQLNRINKVIRDDCNALRAAGLNVVYIDQQAAINDPANDIQIDAIHPSEQGHSKIADMMERVLDEHVQAADSRTGDGSVVHGTQDNRLSQDDDNGIRRWLHIDGSGTATWTTAP